MRAYPLNALTLRSAVTTRGALNWSLLAAKSGADYMPEGYENAV
jgi:hypothetical protein